jgi:hypothetical protein
MPRLNPLSNFLTPFVRGMTNHIAWKTGSPNHILWTNTSPRHLSWGCPPVGNRCSKCNSGTNPASITAVLGGSGPWTNGTYVLVVTGVVGGDYCFYEYDSGGSRVFQVTLNNTGPSFPTEYTFAASSLPFDPWEHSVSFPYNCNFSNITMTPSANAFAAYPTATVVLTANAPFN